MTDIYNVTADELRQFVEQYESLEAEKKDLTEQQKDVMAEAKARGYSTKAIKEVLRLRRMDPDARSEFEAIVELYKASMGLG